MKERAVKIYKLMDPITNDVRYIGKTVYSLNKRLKEHLSDFRGKNTYKKNWIMGLISSGKEPSIELIKEIPESEYEVWEKHYIKLYKSKGTRLVNLTEGGEGNCGGKGNPYPSHIVPVVQYDYDLKKVREWSSCTQAAKYFGIRGSNISKAASKGTTSCGFVWVRKENEKEFINNHKKLCGKVPLARIGNIPATRVRVLDTSTGIIYETIKEVSKVFNIQITNLQRQLNGIKPNTTSFIKL